MALSPLLAGVVFVVGIVIVVFSVEEFVENVAEAAVGLGVSTFLLTVVLAGTDLENAVLGGAAVLGDLPDVGFGTVFGEALFILCAAVGLAGVLVPFEIETPPRYLGLTLLSPLPLLVFIADGDLTQFEGVILVAAFVPLVWLIYRWEQGRETRYLEPEAELRETLTDGSKTDGEVNSKSSETREPGIVGDGDPRESRPMGGLRSRATLKRVGIVVAAVIGMTLGSELAVQGTKRLLAFSGIAGLAFGATVMSVIASLEELFLTVEPVREGRPEVASGNIIGSMLFFVTANAGVLAVIKPIVIPPVVFSVQLPFFLGALGLVLVFLYRGRVTRSEGMALLGVYVAYWVANYR